MDIEKSLVVNIHVSSTICGFFKNWTTNLSISEEILLYSPVSKRQLSGVVQDVIMEVEFSPINATTTALSARDWIVDHYRNAVNKLVTQLDKSIADDTVENFKFKSVEHDLLSVIVEIKPYALCPILEALGPNTTFPADGVVNIKESSNGTI